MTTSLSCENFKKLHFMRPILCRVKVLCYQYYSSPLNIREILAFQSHFDLGDNSSIYTGKNNMLFFLHRLVCYRIKWRYEFNHSKSGTVTFGGSKAQHFEFMKNREWLLGDTIVNELYEYKNLGVLKNYVDSFSSNVEDNIDKTRKKVGLIFASNFDHRKVNPLIYVKLWKQACLPSLLFRDGALS